MHGRTVDGWVDVCAGDALDDRGRDPCRSRASHLRDPSHRRRAPCTPPMACARTATRTWPTAWSRHGRRMPEAQRPLRCDHRRTTSPARVHRAQDLPRAGGGRPHPARRRARSGVRRDRRPVYTCRSSATAMSRRSSRNSYLLRGPQGQPDDRDRVAGYRAPTARSCMTNAN